MGGYLTMFDFTVEVRDGNLKRIGQILPEYLDLTLTDRFNNVGQWELTLPLSHPLVPALRAPGAGIVVTFASGPRAGQTLASGPMVDTEVETDDSQPEPMIKFTGATDSVILADRLAHPEPKTNDPSGAAYDVRTNDAETLLREYADVNMSWSAYEDRRDTRTVVGPSQHRGAVMTKRARFEVLGSLLAEIAAGASYPADRPSYHPGHLGFRLVQVENWDNQGIPSLEFQVYDVADRSADIRLDVHNGTLASHTVATAAPTVTHVVVAGDGEGADRSFVTRSTPESLASAAAWHRRIEVLKDQRATSDETELEQVGDAELNEGGLSQYAMKLVPGEDTVWEFGVDWFMGDIVSVIVRDGGEDPYAATEYATVVTGYVLKANSKGTQVGALLGADQETQLQRIERRLTNLELNSEAGGGGGGNGLVLPPLIFHDMVQLEGGKWFRVGTMEPVTAQHGAKASAEFRVSTHAEWEHMYLRFSVSYGFNNRRTSSLVLEECGGEWWENTPPFTRMRLVPINGYDGACHVELYCVTSALTEVRVEIHNREWVGGSTWGLIPFWNVGYYDDDFHIRGIFWTGRWTGLTLDSRWSTFGPSEGFPWPEFTMHPGSVVEVRGHASTSTNGDTRIFTFPEGCRTQHRRTFVGLMDGLRPCRLVLMHFNGELIKEEGGTGWTPLDSIRFVAEW